MDFGKGWDLFFSCSLLGLNEIYGGTRPVFQGGMRKVGCGTTCSFHREHEKIMLQQGNHVLKELKSISRLREVKTSVKGWKMWKFQFWIFLWHQLRLKPEFNINFIRKVFPFSQILVQNLKKKSNRSLKNVHTQKSSIKIFLISKNIPLLMIWF